MLRKSGSVPGITTLKLSRSESSEGSLILSLRSLLLRKSVSERSESVRNEVPVHRSESSKYVLDALVLLDFVLLEQSKSKCSKVQST